MNNFGSGYKHIETAHPCIHPLLHNIYYIPSRVGEPLAREKLLNYQNFNAIYKILIFLCKMYYVITY